MGDWGEDASEGFARAFGGATEQHFQSNSKADVDNDARDLTVVVCGRWRLAPDWTKSLQVLTFVTVLFGGFVAMHAARIINGPIKNDDALASKNNVSNAASSPSSAETIVFHYLNDYARLISIIALCVTAPFFLVSMASMFLAVFTDPGYLPRLDQLDEKEVARAEEIERQILLASKQQPQRSRGQYNASLTLLGGAEAAAAGAAASRSKSQAALAEEKIDTSVFSETSSNARSSTHHADSNPALQEPLIARDSKNNHGNSNSNNTRLSAFLLAAATEGKPVVAAASTAAIAAAEKSKRAAIIRTYLGTDVPLTERNPLSSSSSKKLVITGHLPPAHSADGEFVTVNNISIQTPFCATCKIRRPVRSSHSNWVGRCVLGFDHHCGLIGASVGHFNLRYFVIFVWTVGALCWGCAISSVLLTVSVSHDHSSPYFIGGVVYCVFCFLLAVQLGCNMACYYFFLVCKGYTNREWVKRDTLYGGSAYGKNPFAVSSCARQCAYVCCPPDNAGPDALDPKHWAEADGRRDVARALSSPSRRQQASEQFFESPNTGLSMPTVGRLSGQQSSPAAASRHPSKADNGDGDDDDDIFGDTERSPLSPTSLRASDYGSIAQENQERNRQQRQHDSEEAAADGSGGVGSQERADRVNILMLDSPQLSVDGASPVVQDNPFL